MKERKLSVAFLLVLLVSLMLVGCFGGGGTKSYTLTGTVTEVETEVPLAGATVQVGTKQTTTNAWGLYELKVPEGSVTLIVAAEGYETHEQDLDLTKDTTMDVELETQAESLDLAYFEIDYVNVNDDWAVLSDEGITLDSYMYIWGEDLFPMASASLILNGEENPLYVDTEDNDFWAYMALRPGLNTIQVRVWDGEGWARTTPIQTLTWNIDPLDLLVILDSDQPYGDLDLHITKRSSSEANSFVYATADEGNRHVFWGNQEPSDFGTGPDQNPICDNDGGSLEDQEIIYLKELTPGDYHIWVHAYSLGGNALTEARVQVILDGATDNPTKKVYQEDFTLSMEEEGVYFITLRVDKSGTKSFVHVEPTL